jgi:hypothetical protein
MRIISDFHDYYDGVQAFGQDKSIVYKRKTINYEIKEAPRSSIISILHDKASVDNNTGRSLFNRLPSTLLNRTHTFYVYAGNIVFCGKLYPYVSLDANYFYDAEAMIAFCEANKLKIDAIRERIEDWFNRQNTLDVNWLIENKIICADVCRNSVIINPQLKSKQFFKVLDPYATFGALDMWICGTLAYPQNAMVELSDKDLITKHGFDKWSFRRRAG